jgi:hypothetical protein
MYAEPRENQHSACTPACRARKVNDGRIRGGVIDGGSHAITGLRIEAVERLEIADLEVMNATHKGIHLLKGGYEKNITRVRCDVDVNTLTRREASGFITRTATAR